MNPDAITRMLSRMPVFILHHRHRPAECRAAFAAWTGFQSPLRRRHASSSCLPGDHSVWWRVEAPDRDAALAMLPSFVAARTAVSEIREIRIP
jgi:hypothetical protein